MIEIKEVVEYLVKRIVDKPEEVEIAEKRGGLENRWVDTWLRKPLLYPVNSRRKLNETNK